MIKMGLAERIRSSVITNFKENDVARVIHCWDNFISGKKLDRYLDSSKSAHQLADCFVDGLTPATFFDHTDKSMFPWVPTLETNHHIILEELVAYELQRQRRTQSVVPSSDVLSLRQALSEVPIAAVEYENLFLFSALALTLFFSVEHRTVAGWDRGTHPAPTMARSGRRSGCRIAACGVQI